MQRTAANRFLRGDKRRKMGSTNLEWLAIEGVTGKSAGREAFLGFAEANLLYSISFADVLDEDTGRGYQRRFNAQHSLDFRKYIQKPSSSTLPLTFNLRPSSRDRWRVTYRVGGGATLHLAKSPGRILVQVDCQHRLGYLNDIAISLPFMCFLGLTEREEMEIFSIINGKAKGLSTSLLDFHDATMATDLARERPELFIALQLNNNSDSPWYRQLDLGGTSTSGLMRRASLRTMQKAIKRFLTQTRILRLRSPDAAAQVVLDFWGSVAVVAREPWENPRRHLLNKGVGVYSLMAIAGDLYLEAIGQTPDKRYFTAALSEFIPDLDWSATGPFQGLGGESGVKSAVELIRRARPTPRVRAING
jgi:DGQHR domain-containing protein